MIKEKLRKDLISFIGSLFGYTADLEVMSYNELFNRYIDLLGIPYDDIYSEIRSELEKYHEQYPDYYIDEEQIINDTGLLQPISMASFIDRQIVSKRVEIMEKQAEINECENDIKQDSLNLKDDRINWAYRAEIPNDISYSRRVIGENQSTIKGLQQEIDEKKELLTKIYSIYETRTGGLLLHK